MLKSTKKKERRVHWRSSMRIIPYQFLEMHINRAREKRFFLKKWNKKFVLFWWSACYWINGSVPVFIDRLANKMWMNLCMEKSCEENLWGWKILHASFHNKIEEHVGKITVAASTTSRDFSSIKIYFFLLIYGNWIAIASYTW